MQLWGDRVRWPRWPTTAAPSLTNCSPGSPAACISNTVDCNRVVDVPVAGSESPTIKRRQAANRWYDRQIVMIPVSWPVAEHTTARACRDTHGAGAMQYRVDRLVGVSGGSIVAALYARGYSTAYLKTWHLRSISASFAGFSLKKMLLPAARPAVNGSQPTTSYQLDRPLTPPMSAWPVVFQRATLSGCPGSTFLDGHRCCSPSSARNHLFRQHLAETCTGSLRRRLCSVRQSSPSRVFPLKCCTFMTQHFAGQRPCPPWR